MKIVIEQVIAERDRQDARWGGSAHDDTHSWDDWARFIDDRNVAAKRLGPLNPAFARERLIQIAALAVAEVEAIDRRFGPKQ